jgi:hypothetical protein
VVTPHDVLLLDRTDDGRGRYACLPRNSAPTGLDWSKLRADWQPFGWVLWCADGHGYRLQIGPVGRPAEVVVLVSGPVESAEGDFSVSLNWSGPDLANLLGQA